MGGLGNQMFQYAFGRALASTNGSELFLDTTFYDSDLPNPNITPRTYSLNQFENLKAKIISPQELSRFNSTLKSRKNSLSGRFKSLFEPYRKLKEKQFHFDGNNLNQRGNLYVEGYWQSEKYFGSIRNILLKEFQLGDSHNQLFESIKQRIVETHSVSIHVRRGDYISNKKAAAWHGTLEESYYVKAIDILKQSLSNFQVFVFSDDPKWVKANLTLDVHAYLVSGRGLSEAEELILISTCDHQIIANSSYSWWGAWLNTYEEKKVIAPKFWFANSEVDSRDIYADNWIKI